MIEERVVPLSMVTPGKEVTIIEILGGSRLRSKLLSMGLIPGVKIKVLSKGSGGPLLVKVKDAKYALGWGMAGKIIVKE